MSKNRSYFNPMNLLANPVKSSKASLSCSHSSPEVTVTEKDKFNLTMFVIDTSTQQQLPNITWSVNLNNLKNIL